MHAGLKLNATSDNIWHFDPYPCHSHEIVSVCVTVLIYSVVHLTFGCLRGSLHARRDAIHWQNEGLPRLEAEVSAVPCLRNLLQTALHDQVLHVYVLLVNASCQESRPQEDEASSRRSAIVS